MADPYYGFFLAAWVVAWIVVGFAILPYLTIVPAEWLIRSAQALSTAEFVTAVVGPADRPPDGPAARDSLVQHPAAARLLAAAGDLAWSSGSGWSG